MTREERELGMDRRISRRDFLQGTALAVAAYASGCTQAPPLDSERSTAPYPPVLTGLRGQDMLSTQFGHQIRDGVFLEPVGRVIDTGEAYDLVVVGAGLAGLATAFVYFRERKGRARILILDNHDDFGGHARRNTFRWQNTVLVAPGGTFALENPESSPREAQEILDALNIEPERLAAFRDPDFKSRFGLSQGVFFDPQVYGQNQPVWATGFYDMPYERFFSQTPLAPGARRELIELYTTKKNYLPANADVQESLAPISWEQFIRRYMRLGDDAVRFTNLYATDLLGLGCDAVSALDGYEVGPGFFGMGGNGFYEKNGILRYAYEPVHRYPDGNHTIARHLVKALIPHAITGPATMEGVFNSSVRYTYLDRPEHPVRLRLRALVYRVVHARGLSHSKHVIVEYARPDGRRFRVRANGAIVAGWGMMAKHIVPELPADQKQALHAYNYCSAIYINVLLRNWLPMADIGVFDMFWPGGYCTWMHIADPLRIGRYQPDYRPEKPTVLSMYKYLYYPGLDPTEQMKLGRLEIEQKPFAEFEREIRLALNALFGRWGFNAANDILAITVNRWGHGYNFFKQPQPLEVRQKAPYLEGRKQVGRISFAGADAGGTPWTQAAFVQAHRAAHEQLRFAMSS